MDLSGRARRAVGLLKRLLGTASLRACYGRLWRLLEGAELQIGIRGFVMRREEAWAGRIEGEGCNERRYGVRLDGIMTLTCLCLNHCRIGLGLMFASMRSYKCESILRDRCKALSLGLRDAFSGYSQVKSETVIHSICVQNIIVSI